MAVISPSSSAIVGSLRSVTQKVLIVPIIYGFISVLPGLMSGWEHSDRLTDKLFNNYDNEENTFDFVVVGGGTAGALVATRLSEHYYKVLLLEAGGTPSPFQAIPALTLKFLNTPQTDWGHKTVPQKKACLNSVNQQSSWSSGRGLGGTTNINFMLHTRGHPMDYESWAADVGDESWGYAGVLPYFKKSETFSGTSNDPEARGHEGELRITKPSYKGLSDDWIRAGQELGYSFVDLNGRHSEGFGILQYPIYKGIRQSTYSAFLLPMVKSPRLTIRKYAIVGKILFRDDDNKAYGVEYERHGATHRAIARKEVILSAGTLGSAKLLMLSGVGPKAHLEELNIPVRSNLPVGRNLQDHLGVHLGPFFIQEPKSFLLDRDVSLENLVRWLFLGTGPITTTGYQGAASIASSSAKSRGEGNWPDLHLILHGQGVHKGYADGFANAYGLKEEEISQYYDNAFDRDSFHITVIGSRPTSNGQVLLSGASVLDPLVVNPRYLEDGGNGDYKVLLEGVKTALNIANSSVFQRLGTQFTSSKLAGCDDLYHGTDEYWECYIRRYTLTMHNPVGTNSLGSVVDKDLRVEGVKNLRVIDASVQPTIVSTGTAAATYMIAEKGVDIILKEQGVVKEYPKEDVVSERYYNAVNSEKKGTLYNSEEGLISDKEDDNILNDSSPSSSLLERRFGLPDIEEEDMGVSNVLNKNQWVLQTSSSSSYTTTTTPPPALSVHHQQIIKTGSQLTLHKNSSEYKRLNIPEEIPKGKGGKRYALLQAMLKEAELLKQVRTSPVVTVVTTSTSTSPSASSSTITTLSPQQQQPEIVKFEIKHHKIMENEIKAVHGRLEKPYNIPNELFVAKPVSIVIMNPPPPPPPPPPPQQQPSLGIPPPVYKKNPPFVEGRLKVDDDSKKKKKKKSKNHLEDLLKHLKTFENFFLSLTNSRDDSKGPIITPPTTTASSRNPKFVKSGGIPVFSTAQSQNPFHANNNGIGSSNNGIDILSSLLFSTTTTTNSNGTNSTSTSTKSPFNIGLGTITTTTTTRHNNNNNNNGSIISPFQFLFNNYPVITTPVPPPLFHLNFVHNNLTNNIVKIGNSTAAAATKSNSNGDSISKIFSSWFQPFNNKNTKKSKTTLGSSSSWFKPFEETDNNIKNKLTSSSSWFKPFNSLLFQPSGNDSNTALKTLFSNDVTSWFKPTTTEPPPSVPLWFKPKPLNLDDNNKKIIITTTTPKPILLSLVTSSSTTTLLPRQQDPFGDIFDALFGGLKKQERRAIQKTLKEMADAGENVIDFLGPPPKKNSNKKNKNFFEKIATNDKDEELVTSRRPTTNTNEFVQSLVQLNKFFNQFSVRTSTTTTTTPHPLIAFLNTFDYPASSSSSSSPVPDYFESFANNNNNNNNNNEISTSTTTSTTPPISVVNVNMTISSVTNTVNKVVVRKNSTEIQ